MPARTPPESIVRPVWTSDNGSMAQETALTRWPRLVQGMIDDIATTAKASAEPQQSEAEKFTRQLKSLKAEIIADAALNPLNSNTAPDLVRLNDQLKWLGKVSWLNSPWLFAECYLYRRVQSLFAESENWKGYDIFKAQKEDSLNKSRPAVEELAAFFTKKVCTASSAIRQLPEQEQRLLFLEMTQVALWGNGTDLSLLSGMSTDELRSLQGRKFIEDNRRNIVDDDSEAVYSYLFSPTRTNRRIDIVLDNAGFELFTDLVYAAYLLESGLASCVVLWVKDFPWFVSDATQADVSTLLQHLQDPKLFPDRDCAEPVGRALSRFFEEGSITVRSHAFWTTAESFHSMQTHALGLLKSLQSSALVIFKGDLNYRKLTMDGLWPHDTPFSTALGPLGSGSGVKILALRTNKADVCVGVEDHDFLERLLIEQPAGIWLRDGKHAVISFSDGCSERP